MKAKIHPTYYPDMTVTCSCGNTFTSGSTKQSLNVEVCSKCHPFYTGEHRFVDVKGRVERFQKKQQTAGSLKAVLDARKLKKSGGKEEKKVKTLKELLAES